MSVCVVTVRCCFVYSDCLMFFVFEAPSTPSKLSETVELVISKRVVVMILLMLFIIPLLTVDRNDPDKFKFAGLLLLQVVLLFLYFVAFE